MRCRQSPQGNTYHQGQEDRTDGKLEGGGTVDHDDVGYRSLVGQRAPKVPAQHAAEVLPILGPDGPVEPRLGLAFGDLGGREPPTGLCGDGIADTAHEHEHQRHQDPCRRNDQCQTYPEIAQQRGAHAALPVFFSGVNWNLNEGPSLIPSTFFTDTAICFPVSSGSVEI